MKYYLEIKEPCSENWNEMSPTEKGRFCASCEKEVIDFIHFSDSQLNDFLRTNNSRFCGRFKESQLNREISFPTEKSKFKNVLQLTTGFLLLNFLAHGSGGNHRVETQLIKHEQNKDSIVIKGIIVDSISGNPIEDALVYSNLNCSSRTTKEGKFEMTIRHPQDTIDLFIEHCAYSDTAFSILADVNFLELKLEVDESKCNQPLCTLETFRQVEITEGLVSGGPSMVTLRKGEPGVRARRSLFGFLRRKRW